MDEPEEGRESPEAGGCRSEIMGEALEVGVDGQQAIGADEGDDLVDGCEEGYRIDGSQETKDEEAGEPIGGKYLHTSNLPNFLIDATPDGLSSVKTGTKPFVMKRFMLVGAPVFLVFFVLACSKGTVSGNISGRWKIVVDSNFTGVGTNNHLAVYNGFAGDYFEFAGNDSVYMKEGSVLDTLRYTFLADSVHIIISGFGLGGDTSVISDHTATSMVITSNASPTPGGFFWRKVVLSK
jgi:hypothetical protein